MDTNHIDIGVAGVLIRLAGPLVRLLRRIRADRTPAGEVVVRVFVDAHTERGSVHVLVSHSGDDRCG